MPTVLQRIVGTKQKRDLQEMIPIVRDINALEGRVLSLRDGQFAEETARLRESLKTGAKIDDVMSEAFALAREAGRRVLGERAFDTQLMGAVVLHRGGIMEMKTGEGKTLSSVLAAYLNALTGRGVHIVTVNDYLAERDAGWMGPIYKLLGLSVGFVLSQMDTDARSVAYRCDITYGTNNEFGFDYLRDNMKWDAIGKVQRNHHFCIVDEIDSILIDEARTPLIISGATDDDTAVYNKVNACVGGVRECEKDPETRDYPEEPVGDYKMDEKAKKISFTDQGMNQVEETLQKRGIITGSLFDIDNFEFIHHFTQAMRAHHLFRKDVDYVVQDGKVEIVDEFTGRILHGRRYSDGLHQAIEAKEGIRVAQRNRTLATITFQNFFRMYEKLAGMTGTADTEAKEFAKIYNLEVTVIPTNRPVVRADSDDIMYLTESEKLESICEEIARVHKKGQPVLVGTVSIEKSELLSRMLTQRGVRHEVLNAKNHAREAVIIAEAGSQGAVTIATNMAGRGTDIKLGGNADYRARRAAGTEASEERIAESIVTERERWAPLYENVKGAGGLYVLGTERHESRRIDNQLRGRSGRQGDPGESRFFISMDDDLMRLFGENLKSLMARVGMREGEPIFHPWINKSIERAQKKVEERNFEIRKHLLDYDDVLNEQRNFIYGRRDEILEDGDLKQRVLATAREIVEDAMTGYKEASPDNVAEILVTLKEAVLYTPQFAVEGLTLSNLRERIIEQIEEDLTTKEKDLGPDSLNLFIRYEYLRSIDSRWQDHLENLEALREAVYLRTYAQKNPLLEYKLEGFQIFDQMLMDIRRAIAARVLRVHIESFEGRRVVTEREPVGSAIHRQLGQFFGAGTGGRTSAGGRPQTQERPEAGPRQVQFKRITPKVGRNDPCPCGSGKKYKHCCGR